jgi:hypothetical protein
MVELVAGAPAPYFTFVYHCFYLPVYRRLLACTQRGGIEPCPIQQRSLTLKARMKTSHGTLCLPRSTPETLAGLLMGCAERRGCWTAGIVPALVCRLESGAPSAWFPSCIIGPIVPGAAHPARQRRDVRR